MVGVCLAYVIISPQVLLETGAKGWESTRPLQTHGHSAFRPPAALSEQQGVSTKHWLLSSACKCSSLHCLLRSLCRGSVQNHKWWYFAERWYATGRTLEHASPMQNKHSLPQHKPKKLAVLWATGAVQSKQFCRQLKSAILPVWAAWLACEYLSSTHNFYLKHAEWIHSPRGQCHFLISKSSQEDGWSEAEAALSRHGFWRKASAT